MSGSAISMFFGGRLLGVIVIVVEWINYIQAAKRVRAAARAEGQHWPFTRDGTILIRFVYMPNSLLDQTDGTKTRAAKLDLLRLRKRMWKVIGLGVGLLALGFCAAVVGEILKQGAS
ncbi:MAG: hypothetical protein V7609_40 [Verrucomicrobiota bacterium]